MDTLLDAAPEGVAQRIREAAAAVPGVVSVERVRVRPGGGQVFGEVKVRVARTLPLERVAALKERIAGAIAADMPQAEITVSTEPVQLDDETVLERVLLIAAKQRLPVHHVIVQEVEGGMSLSLDLEVDGRLPLRAAHARADRLEEAIRAELGPGIEVETHIEPLRVSPLAGRDAEPEAARRIEAALEDLARAIAPMADVHSVRVRRTDAGLVVNYHCCFDPALPVADVHAHVDELERRMRERHPEILRMIGHAEPIGTG
jgi:divalent metal cation (Fe/Co/Zn/Cd) transporter